LQLYAQPFVSKGTYSNVASATCFALGLALPHGPVQAVILSAGMFAFSGGITNTLAVKMLFDRVPGLVGSGVIPARFREIRSEIKRLILTHFFDGDHLRTFLRANGSRFKAHHYLKGGEKARGVVTAFIDQQWERFAAPDVIRPIVDEQIEKLLDSSLGGMLIMVGVENVKPAVSQFVSSLVASLKEKVLERTRSMDESVLLELDEERILADIRRAADELLESKLQQLDAQTVKKMLEGVIRDHLGWLVVWGNVLGGLIGLAVHWIHG